MEDNQSYGGGHNKSKRHTSKSKDGDVQTQDTTRLTSSDENYPTDVGNDKIYWKYWSDTNGVLREVIDQGNRNTCWVHGTIRSLEAQLKIKFDLDVSLSAKHLYHGIVKKKSLEAVRDFEEIEKFLKIEGVVLEKDCECEKRTDKKDPCTKKIEVILDSSGKHVKKIEEKIVPVLKIDKIVTTKEVNEEELIQSVKLGPVMVSLDATKELKDHRGSGIFYGPKSTKKAIGNHIVLVTGYDSTKHGEHYWIIQNSWGDKWGEGGFGKIARKISRGKDQHFLFADIICPVVSAADGLV